MPTFSQHHDERAATRRFSAGTAALCVAVVFALGACSTVRNLTGQSEPSASGTSSSTGSGTTADASTKGSGSSSADSAPAKGKVGPGMNASGEVVDPKLVEAGYGRKVKGINDFEGEITGVPAKNSKFSKLQIGMSMRQVMDAIGPPTDQGGYVTGKAWIPFYFGGDRHRYEMAYKGQGRLIFAGGGLGDLTSGHLIWIIHFPKDTGYR